MKKEIYWRCVEIIDMIEWLGFQSWGYAGNGRIRLSKDSTAINPEFSLSNEEIKELFTKQFSVIPVKPNSGYVKIVKR